MTVVEMAVRRVSLPRLDSPNWEMYGDLLGNLGRFTPGARLEVKATWSTGSTTGRSLTAVKRSLETSRRTPDVVSFRIWADSVDISGALYDVTDHGGPPTITIGAVDRFRLRNLRDIVVEVLEAYADDVRASAILPGSAPQPPPRWKAWFGSVTTNVIAAGVIAILVMIAGVVPTVVRWVTGSQTKTKASPKEAVSNNSFRFRIDGRPQCELRSYSDENGNVRYAKGHVCIFQLTVVNLSQSADYPRGPFRVSIVKQQFGATASTGEAFTQDVFPGHNASGALVFDLPVGASPDKLVIGSPRRDDKIIVFDLTDSDAWARTRAVVPESTS